MALSDKELKEIIRHCVCGRPNFVFIKHYKWRNNSESFLRSSGLFYFCNDKNCIFSFDKFIQLEKISKDACLGTEYYYTATGLTLDKLIETW